MSFQNLVIEILLFNNSFNFQGNYNIIIMQLYKIFGILILNNSNYYFLKE